MKPFEREPTPSVIMTGCQPWPPRSDPGDRCPVCKAGIRSIHHGRYCGWSDEGSPAFEARQRAAKLGIGGKERSEEAHRKLTAEQKKVKHSLSESERRRIWNGTRHCLGSALADRDLTNPAREGREWLTRIGQEPRWELILDRRGVVVGRYEMEEAEEEEADLEPEPAA